MRLQRRVLWHDQFNDWVQAFRPSRRDCRALFEWVLDVTEFGPPDDAEPADVLDGWAYSIEDAHATVFYTVWNVDPVVSFVEILSYR